MAIKEPIDSDTEIEAPDAGERLSDVSETIAAKVIQTASASAATFIDGQKVTPEQAAKRAQPPKPSAKAPPKGQNKSAPAEEEEREGFSRAYDQTFGAGAFRVDNDGQEGWDMDQAGNSTNSGPIYGVSSNNNSGEKPIALQQTEAWFSVTEMAMGGDGNPYTSDAFRYDSHNFSNNPYSSNDFSSNYTRLSQIRYEDGYIDDGLGCSRYGGQLDEATRSMVENIHAWKTDSAIVQLAQRAIVDEETGLVYVDGKEMDPNTDPEAQKIVAAKIGLALEPEKAAPMAFKPKAELDAMAAENPLFKQPEILAKNADGTVPPAAFGPKKDPLSISGIGQAGDLAVGYQSIDQITAAALKGSSLGAPAGPLLADLDPLKQPKVQMGPVAAGPAGPAPAPV